MSSWIKKIAEDLFINVTNWCHKTSGDILALHITNQEGQMFSNLSTFKLDYEGHYKIMFLIDNLALCVKYHWSKDTKKRIQVSFSQNPCIACSQVLVNLVNSVVWWKYRWFRNTSCQKVTFEINAGLQHWGRWGNETLGIKNLYLNYV